MMVTRNWGRLALIALVLIAASSKASAEPKSAKPAAPAAKVKKPVKKSIALNSLLKANGKVHEANGKKAPLSPGKSAVAALATGGLSSTNSVLSVFGDIISQVVDSTRNQVILSTNKFGNFTVFLYANPYLGYINLTDGSLLFCDSFRPTYTTSVPIIDCQKSASIDSTSSYAVYSNGRAVRMGSTFYYEDGRILRDSGGNWFYNDGTAVYSSYYKNYQWGNGRTLWSDYYKELYYPSGAILFSNYYKELRFESPNSRFYDTNTYDALYKDGGLQLSHYYQDYNGDDVTYYKYWNSDLLANFRNNVAQIYYPRFVADHPEWTHQYLKIDTTPFNGRVLDEYGYDQVYIQRTFPLPSGGQVIVDTDRYNDTIAIVQQDGFASHVVLSNRQRPLSPPSVQSLNVTSFTAKKINLAWTSGGGSTTGYVIASQQGLGPVSCQNGVDFGTNTAAQYKDLNPDTNYTFGVCAKNLVGDLSQVATLTVRTKAAVPPPAVTSLSIGSLIFKSATLQWSSGGGSTVDFLVAVAAGDQAPSCSNGTVASGSPLTVGSLNEKTQYTFAVCARDEDGFLSQPATLKATTPEHPVPPAISNLTVGSVIFNNVNLSWTSGGSGTSDYVVKAMAGNAAPSCDGGQGYSGTSASVSGLNELTLYTFAVCARNEYGFLSAPMTIQATTPAHPVPPAVSQLAVSLITDESARLSWTSGGGDTSGYVIKLVANGTPGSCDGASRSSSAPELALAQLASLTNYGVAVCAVNPYGFQSAPAILNFATLEHNPAVSNLAASNVREDSFSVSWTPGAGSIQFIVRLSKTPLTTCRGATASTKALSYAFQKLAPLTHYSVAVCAKDKKGKLSPPAILAVATPAREIPPAVSGLSLGQITKSSAELLWSSGGGNTAGFVAAIAKGTSAPTCKVASSPLKIGRRVFTGLQKNTVYTAAVCAQGANRVLSPVTTIVVQTAN